MKRIMTALAVGTALSFGAASVASANPLLEPRTFSSRPQVFEAADLNDDNMLSRMEYNHLRMNTVDDRLVYYYRGDTRQQAETEFARTFAELDMDRNGWVSATEFANAPAVQPGQDNRPLAWGNDRGWDPEYMTVSYYLMANPVEADTVEGKTVVNLKGDEVGTIDRIIRTDAGKYYAMLDLEGRPMYRPSGMERDSAGVPLEDVLLFDRGHSLMLTTRGEEYLEDADARRLEWNDYEVVDTLYRVG